jgi:hypothetical protein
MVRRLRTALLASAALGWLAGAPAYADGEPMDLRRSDARPVEVQVVTMSATDGTPRLSPPVRGWFEAGPRKNQGTVSVPGAVVERTILADRHPVASTFSDFVWTFDIDTGEVSSSLTGLVDQPIVLGPLHLVARVAISFSLSTETTAGYTPPRALAGQTVVGYCDPGSSDCTAASSALYDPSTGWVQANGPVCAAWHAYQTRAYTTLGHARFLELDRHDGGGSTPPAPALRQAERSVDPAG